MDGPVRFGRHPDSDVAFHARRDIDASAHHAALRAEADRFLLVDLGSSNGTFVDGESIDRHELHVGVAVEVVFGEGGPRCRVLILGEQDDAPDADAPMADDSPAPRKAHAHARSRSRLLLYAALAVSVIVLAGAAVLLAR